MKFLLHTIIVALVLTGCSGGKDAATKQPETMQLGWMQRSDFVRAEFPKFQENYDTTRVDENFIEMIKTLHSDIDIVVVLGTWCGDSKREVPRFLKIADRAFIPPQQIRFYGVDRTKKSNDGVTEKYRIELVPTFIFLKHGEEVGRIVESPKNSIEEDMLVILADAQTR